MCLIRSTKVLLYLFQALVCTLPKCLCKLPTDADCVSATTTPCAGQDGTFACTGPGAIVLAAFTACAPGQVCYEELVPTSSPTSPACAAEPSCSVAGTFAYATGKFSLQIFMT
jgi:hypothetical protein